MASYATLAEYRARGVLSRAFASIPDADVTAALEGNSRLVDGYMRAQWKLPLLSWDSLVTGWVCKLTDYDLMSHRGYNPTAANDVVTRMRYDDAISQLERANAGKLTPGVVDSYSGSTAGVTQAAGPTVYTAPLRGYSQNGGNEAGPFVDAISEDT